MAFFFPRTWARACNYFARSGLLGVRQAIVDPKDLRQKRGAAISTASLQPRAADSLADAKVGHSGWA